MGYRSKFTLAICGETAKKIKREMVLGVSLASISELLGETSFSEDGDNVLYFELGEVKMYESYPEVSSFYTWLNSLDEDEFRYYEIGEEEGDITSKGCAPDLLCLSTTVERY